MLKYIFLLSSLLLFSNCHVNKSVSTTGDKYFEIINEEYHLAIPKNMKNTNDLLVLFGGSGQRPFDVKREFGVLDLAMQENLPVLYLNSNQKLWLEDSEKEELANLILDICKDFKLENRSLTIGGYSLGGNVAFLISDYLKENQSLNVEVEGVFAVDSPVDLAELYRTAEHNVAKNFSEPSVNEGNWILAKFDEKFGSPDESISKYEQYSIYTMQSNYTKNVDHLKNTKIRLYTEPDKTWWKVNRDADYERMNAYMILKMAESLKGKSFTTLEYIPTENKGYRANGTRHPHSWSIIDKPELLKWILN